MELSVWKRKVNIFLLGIPIVRLLTTVLAGMPHRTLLIFTLSALALIPLAGFLESAVEELAELLGEFVGGLLHTTGSNVAELAIGLSLLLSLPGSGAQTIVLSSIAGVLLRNSLLFLGLATFLGCLRNGRMKFSAQNAGEYSTVFALAVIGLCLPTLAHYVFSADVGGNGNLLILQRYPLGLVLSGVLLVTYLAYIVFVVFHVRAEERTAEAQPRRRRRKQQDEDFPLIQTLPDTQALFHEEQASAVARLEGRGTAVAVAEPAHSHRGRDRQRHARAQLLAEKRAARAERGEQGFLAGHRVLRGILAVLVLGVSTAGVAYMSEQFAQAVERVPQIFPTILGQKTESYDFFLGLIVIPVVAGAVELYGSVGMARRKKMEITMAVTAGASIQMILLVVPVLVIVGFVTGHPLLLLFNPLSVIVLGGATYAFMLLSRDGESTLMEGVQLISLWLLLAVTALILNPASA